MSLLLLVKEKMYDFLCDLKKRIEISTRIRKCKKK